MTLRDNSATSASIFPQIAVTAVCHCAILLFDLGSLGAYSPRFKTHGIGFCEGT